jgi:peptidoglycan/LPS O-acetylase OafA/YrhL
VALAFLAAQLVCSRVLGGRLFGPVGLALALGLGNLLNSLAIAVLLWAVVARPTGVCGRMLNHPVAVGVGTISYSLYLWHALFCQHEGAFVSFPLSLVLVFACALLSYTLIEKPFLALKDRLSAVGRTPALPRLAATAARPRPLGARHEEPSLVGSRGQ